MVSKRLFYGISALYISSLLFQFFMLWISDISTITSLFWVFFVFCVYMWVWTGRTVNEEKWDEEFDRTLLSILLGVITLFTLCINIIQFFSIKFTCDFNYTTTFKVFTLGTDDSDKIKNVCTEEKEKAKTVSLVSFVWELEKVKGCTISNKNREIIYDIKHLSKEDFDRDYEINKKFLLNVVEDCKSDIIRNNLLKDKNFNSNVDTYLKEINEFKTKIENISNK